jgi:tRNA (adenine57-N1/adenine58-N1)-methyltransferase
MKARVLMTAEGRKLFVRDIASDYHSEFGFVAKKDLKKKSGIVKTNTGKELFIFEPLFIDLYRKIRRGPQIVSQKDIGLIVSEAGISRKSLVVDAGAGSGALCCFLANIAGKVVAYEIREDFLKVAKGNVEFLGQKNIVLKHGDVYQGIDERNVDLITLDLPEPWKALDAASKSLRPGGFLVAYSPTVPQIADFANEVAKRKDFSVVKTTELIERTWEAEERKVRPRSRMIGHTGFLCFARKA